MSVLGQCLVLTTVSHTAQMFSIHCTVYCLMPRAKLHSSLFCDFIVVFQQSKYSWSLCYVAPSVSVFVILCLCPSICVCVCVCVCHTHTYHHGGTEGLSSKGLELAELLQVVDAGLVEGQPLLLGLLL